jgi:hypothetical protein
MTLPCGELRVEEEISCGDFCRIYNGGIKMIKIIFDASILNL